MTKNILPPSIAKIEQKDFDEHIGKAEDLIAAGLVKTEQFPPEGKWSVSYLGGVATPRRCRMDETYLRVSRRSDSDAPWSVRVGLPREELLRRRAEARERNSIKRAAAAAKQVAQMTTEDLQSRQKKAALAQRELDEVPTSERDFLRKSVRSLRDYTVALTLKRLDEPCSWNGGYRFSTETKEAAMLAVDAIVEVMLQGEVIFDPERHAQILAGHQAVIRSADQSFERHLKALTAHNTMIVEGEDQ